MKRNNENEIFARIILSTKRKKRELSIVQVANDINSIISIYKDKKKVAELLGLSQNMINRFLSVLKLSERAQKYFKEGKIKVVNVAYYLRTFDEKEQVYILEKIIKGEMSNQDIRALAPLKKNFPELNIRDLIKKLLNSKNTKIYVIYFQIPNLKTEKSFILNKISNVIEKSNIISLKVNEYLGILKISEEGYKKIIDFSKNRKVSIKKSLEIIISL